MVFRLLPLFLFLCITVSCSSDNGDLEPVNQENNANYFPLVAENTWSYNNVQETEGEENQESTDVLTVNSTTTIFGNTYFNFLQDEIQEGFTTALFANGAVRKDNSKLIYKGTLNFEFDGIDPIEIHITDATVYNKTAIEGMQLYELNNTVTQTIMDIPVTISFTIRTEDAGQLENLTVGTEEFTDVIASKVIVNVDISASFDILGTPVTIPILMSQDVINATNYYASDIGLVYSDVLFEYQLEDLSQFNIELPFPESATINSTQSITDWNVTLED
jgi:hypothetical protein